MINADLIETIESAPDTIISLTSKAKFVVRESPEEIIDRIMKYRKRLQNNNFGEDLDDPSFRN